MSKTLTKAGFAAFALAGTVLATPLTASANHDGYYYNNQTRTAHEQCKRDEDKDILVGAAIGAVIGGVVGSNVAADGVRGEGTALGAVVGGLAGGAIADKSIDCDDKVGYTNGYYDNGYNRNVVYGDGSYRNDDYYRTQPRVIYQQPRTGYYGSQDRYYRTGGYYPAQNYGQQRSREVHRRNAARKAYKKGYRDGHRQGHYHGNHICYDHH